MNATEKTICILLIAAPALWAACSEDSCDFGASWCEENAVKYCGETHDCTMLHCTESRKPREETDCGTLGAFCREFGADSGRSVAFCSATEQPCPTGISSFCVGDALAVCHAAYNYPELIVDCREELKQACVQHGAEATCE